VETLDNLKTKIQHIKIDKFYKTGFLSLKTTTRLLLTIVTIFAKGCKTVI